MQKYSIPRHIWRVIYPLLIFIGISLIVPFVAAIAYAVYFGIQTVATGGTLNPATIETFIFDFLLEASLWFLFVSNVISTLIFSLIWRKARTRLPVYDNTKLRFLPAVLTALLFVGLNLILVSVMNLTDLTRHFPSHEVVSLLLTSGSFIMRIIVIGLIAPVAEELLFRGLIQNRLCAWMPTWVAVLLTNALFGLIHFNLLQGLYAFVIGIFYSLLYLRYRNLWILIIGHVAFNLASVVLREVLDAAGIVEINAWLFMIPSLLITVACILLLLKRTNPAALIRPQETTPAIHVEGL